MRMNLFSFSNPNELGKQWMGVRIEIGMGAQKDLCWGRVNSNSMCRN